MSILKNKVTKSIWFSLPHSLRYFISSKLRYPGFVPTGWVDFGDLRRLKPIDNNYGYGRGVPIDRHYIEQFLASHSADIKGRVLEIGDDRYTVKFGGDKVKKSDILNLLKETNPNTTIIADLTSAPHIPSDTFDCIIISETLQLIYGLQAAIKTLYRILKPGGVVLATLSGIGQIADKTWTDHWCWNFTRVSARKLFSECFPDENIEADYKGNVLVAVSFLQGLALHELDPEELEYSDPEYQCFIQVLARKPHKSEIS